MKKTNFDVITEYVEVLAEFLEEFDSQVTGNNPCVFCCYENYESCPVDTCKEGFKAWLEKEVE